MSDFAPTEGTPYGEGGRVVRKGIPSVYVSVSRRCSRTACRQPAVFTLTYVYADSTAVLGPLAAYVEPHCYDLCAMHADRLTAPLGWEIVRLPADTATGGPGSDDLEALANAVREAGRQPVKKPRPEPHRAGDGDHPPRAPSRAPLRTGPPRRPARPPSAPTPLRRVRPPRRAVRTTRGRARIAPWDGRHGPVRSPNAKPASCTFGPCGPQRPVPLTIGRLSTPPELLWVTSVRFLRRTTSGASSPTRSTRILARAVGGGVCAHRRPATRSSSPTTCDPPRPSWPAAFTEVR